MCVCVCVCVTNTVSGRYTLYGFVYLPARRVISAAERDRKLKLNFKGRTRHAGPADHDGPKRTNILHRRRTTNDRAPGPLCAATYII